MAAFSPRTSSPTSERSTANFRSPDRRNAKRAQNANSGMKTNSPADFHQRSSVLRERSVSHRTSFEHKEDEKDENRNCPKVVRSGPLPSFTKGPKSFMAPTISAASKVAASPRKKVLTERNAIDHNASPFSSVSPLRFQEPETFMKTTNEDPPSEVNPKKDTEPDGPKNPKIFAGAVPNDTSLPPYDPHVNFLSPRPEFLRYSPNPRLERYRRGESGARDATRRQLESSFASESSSSSEEVQGNNGSEIGFSAELEADGDNEENHPSEIGVFSEFEAGESLLSHESDAENEQQGIEASSPESETKIKSQQKVADAQFCVSKNSYSKSFLKPKIIPIILALAIASLSLPMTDSPVFFSSVMYHGNVSSLSSVSQIEQGIYQEMLSIADVADERGRAEIKQIYNIKVVPAEIENVSAEPPPVGHQILSSYAIDSTAVTEVAEPELNTEATIELPHSELEADGGIKRANQEALPLEEVIQNIEIAESATDTENSETEFTALQPLVPSHSEECELSENIDSMTVSEALPLEEVIQNIETAVSATDTENSETGFTALQPLVPSHSEECEMHVLLPENIDSMTVSDVPEEVAIREPSSATTQLKLSSLSDKILAIQAAVGVLFVALTTLAATYRKTHNCDMKKTDFVKTKTADTSHDNIRNYSVSELEMTGESYSVEMSSTTLEKTMSYPSGSGGETEDISHSCERRQRARGGSSACNSEDSPSYGSFTTYEKLPPKQGCADEGTVTPVRRSSRIRKQMISL